MTTIIEQPTDSGSSAAGMILGILLAIALIVGGLYFYNAGGMGHTETNTTTIMPAAPSAPAPAPAAPADSSSSSSQ